MNSNNSHEKAFAALNQAFSERYHSLARYVLHSGVFISDADRPLLAIIEEIATYDAEQAERLSDLIEHAGGIPQVVPIDRKITELNYLNLPYMGEFLRESLCGQAARYDVLLSEAASLPEASKALAELRQTLLEQADRLALSARH